MPLLVFENLGLGILSHLNSSNGKHCPLVEVMRLTDTIYQQVQMCLDKHLQGQQLAHASCSCRNSLNSEYTVLPVTQITWLRIRHLLFKP